MTHRTAWAVKGSLSSARLLAALCKAASCPRSPPLPDLLPQPPRAFFLLCWQSPGAALRDTQPPRCSQEPQGKEEFLLLQELGIEGRGIGEGGGTFPPAPSHRAERVVSPDDSLGACLHPFSARAGRGSRAWQEAIAQMGKLRHGEGKKCPEGMEGRPHLTTP